MPGIRIIEGSNKGEYFQLHDKPVTLGRVSGDVRINDPKVSSRHVVLRPIAGKWWIEDLNSTNGTFLNDQPVDEPVRVRIHDKFRIGSSIIELVDDQPANSRRAHSPEVVPIKRLMDGRILIGRSSESDFQLDEPIVSRRHAVVELRNGQPILTDCGSANGTFVNGKRTTTTALSNGDRISIGATDLVWCDSGLVIAQGKGPIKLDVRDLCRTITHGGKPKTLINSINFSVHPGEFVGLVGGSGAGKTSLFRVLTGQASPTSGSVCLNGTDFHRNPRRFAGQVGFVPQDDIVHRELNVRSALTYTAHLRLPRDTSPAELQQRVASVLENVSLTSKADSEIRLLSGGERKRVNVALELLTEPNLMYLDEPTSGLDPHRERQMMELMRDLAEQGRTVLVTTHSTLSLDLCDLLLVLGAGGSVVYYGPPRDALAHFGCSDYKDIYSAIGETEGQVAKAQNKFWRSAAYKQYVVERAKDDQLEQPTVSTPDNPITGVADWLHQFSKLSQRYASVLRNDRTNLSILFAQAPLITLIMLLVFPHNTFDSAIDSAGRASLRYASPIVFLLALSAIWFGTSNSIREIVKELAIVNRERLAFLSPSAYFCSKFAVLASLCALQCLVLILGVGAGMAWFHVDTTAVLKMLGVLLLASFAGLSMGLALSTLSRSSDQAVSLTPLALLPQVIFSGIFLPDSAGGSVKLLSELHASHWAFGALGYIADINGKIGRLPQHVLVPNSCFDGEISTKLGSLSLLLVVMATCALILVGKRRNT